MKELRKRGERGEENFCEKRIVLSAFTRDWRCMDGTARLYRILCHVFDYVSRICWGNGLVREVTEI
jgi:hypothetical protein